MSHNNKKISSIRFIFLMIISFNVLFLKAQMSCEIKIDEWVSLPVCYGQEITLSVEANSNYTYQWKKDGVILTGMTDFYLTDSITKNGVRYGVEVINNSTQEECSDEIVIDMMNKFNIEFEQTQLTCSNNDAENGQNAKVIANAYGDGFESFTYEWGSNSGENIWTNPSNPQEAIGLKAWKEYYVDVIGVTASGDSCMQTAYFTPKAYPNPLVEIISTPKDTAYIQNPHVIFSFEGNMDSIEYNSWSWAFYDNPENPNEISNTSILEKATNTYTQESKEGSPFRVELTIKSAEYGCDTTFKKDMIVLPVKLKIPNIFTPNGDGINDYFIIDNDSSAATDEDEEEERGGLEYESYNPLRDYYLKTSLTIFNRWGRVVYKSDDYNNDWDGGNLPDGAYFYVLECVGEQNNHRYQGSVRIFGSGR